MTESFNVTVGGAKIAGERACAVGRASAHGVGTVVFLHAGVADKRMWRRQLLAFGENLCGVAYDRRGFGETTTPEEPFSHVEDLRQVLAGIGAHVVSLVGCSQGGRIAIDFALAYPESVSKLALIAPAISGAPDDGGLPDDIQLLSDELDAADEADDLERINQIEAHLWLDGPRSRAGRVGGELRELFLDMNGTALKQPELSQEIEPPSAYDRLAELRCPTLVMHGDLDFPFIIDRCTHLVEVIPNAQAVQIPGTAHMPNMEQPELVTSHLSRFLAGSAPTGMYG